MAKKTGKTKNNEVVTVSDNQQFEVANCDLKQKRRYTISTICVYKKF